MSKLKQKVYPSRIKCGIDFFDLRNKWLLGNKFIKGNIRFSGLFGMLIGFGVKAADLKATSKIKAAGI